MSFERLRNSAMILSLLLASASLVPATSGPAVEQPAFAPALTFNASSLSLAGGSNCDSDADCPSGSYCYHDPIALVPYCVAGSGEQIEL